MKTVTLMFIRGHWKYEGNESVSGIAQKQVTSQFTRAEQQCLTKKKILHQINTPKLRQLKKKYYYLSR